MCLPPEDVRLAYEKSPWEHLRSLQVVWDCKNQQDFWAAQRGMDPLPWCRARQIHATPRRKPPSQALLSLTPASRSHRPATPSPAIAKARTNNPKRTMLTQGHCAPQRTCSSTAYEAAWAQKKASSSPPQPTLVSALWFHETDQGRPWTRVVASRSRSVGKNQQSFIRPHVSAAHPQPRGCTIQQAATPSSATPNRQLDASASM